MAPIGYVAFARHLPSSCLIVLQGLTRFSAISSIRIGALYAWIAVFHPIGPFNINMIKDVHLSRLVLESPRGAAILFRRTIRDNPWTPGYAASTFGAGAGGRIVR